MHYPKKHETGQLNKHVVVFSVSVRRCVGSGVAARRVGAARNSFHARSSFEGAAIKHNGHCVYSVKKRTQTK